MKFIENQCSEDNDELGMEEVKQLYAWNYRNNDLTTKITYSYRHYLKCDKSQKLSTYATIN